MNGEWNKNTFRLHVDEFFLIATIVFNGLAFLYLEILVEPNEFGNLSGLR